MESPRDTLIVEHFPRVRKLAARMRRPVQVELDDLVQAGAVGLIEAADSFDPARGVKFWTFAERRVRGSIQDWQRGEDPMSRDERKLEKEGKREPVKSISISHFSPGGEPRKDLDIPDVRNTPDAHIEERDRARVLRQAIASLPPRTRVVMTRYYFGEVPMKQIGREIGVNESRVSQIRKAAAQKISLQLAARGMPAGSF